MARHDYGGKENGDELYRIVYTISLESKLLMI